MATPGQGAYPWNLAAGKTSALKSLCAKAWCSGRIRTDILCHKLAVGEDTTCRVCGTQSNAPMHGAPGTQEAKAKGFGKGKTGKGSGK